MYISGMGVLTPVGGDVEMTLASVSAGLNVYMDSSNLDDRGQAVKMGIVPSDAIPPISSALSFYGRYSLWHKRLLQLAHVAVAQAMEGYRGQHPIPVILNLPEIPVLDGKPFPQDFLSDLAIQSETALSSQHCRVLHGGRAGVIEALSLAEKLLFERDFDEVLVGGVDSYQLPNRLADLLRDDRIARERNTDGFTPGEGAGFVRVTRHQSLSVFGNAYLESPHIANEPGHLYGDGGYMGEGLADVVSGACTNSAMPKVTHLYVTANGERYWAKEMGTSIIRNQACLEMNYEVLHPAEFYGDLGAASAVVQLALAAHRYQPGQAHLISASSDYALRGAVLFGEAQQPHSTDENDPPVNATVG